MSRLERLPILQLRCPRGDDLSLWIAESYAARLVGLASAQRLDAGQGMLIPRCRSVHTAGMKFAIDVLFAERSGGSIARFQVVQVHHRVLPWRLIRQREPGRTPVHAIELAAGTAVAAGISRGSRLSTVTCGA